MFNDMFRRYSVCCNEKLIKLLKPLEEYLAVKHFCYYKITNQGRYHFIGSHLPYTEYFYAEKLYLDCPYLLHPDNYQSGISFSKNIPDPLFQDSQEQTHQIFDMNVALTVLEKDEDGIQGFAFASNARHPYLETLYFNEIPIFQHFIRVFKDEYRAIIHKMDDDNIDLSTLAGHSFNTKKIDLVAKVKDREEMLRKMGVAIPFRLTRREKEIAKQIARGYTAKEIGMLLNLSKRTAEHYIEILKCIFHCSSKSELIQRTQELAELGYLQ